MNQLYRCLCLAEPSQVEEIQSYAARHGEADLESIAPELGDQSWKIREEHSRASLPVTPSFMSSMDASLASMLGTNKFSYRRW